MSTLEQIDALCNVEQNQEAWAAQLVVTKLAELETALELAAKVVVTNDGDDAIGLLQDGIGDSGIHSWISACREAGLFPHSAPNTAIERVAA